MIPPKLGDAWISKVIVTIGKETHHAMLDLGSSVSVSSKELLSQTLHTLHGLSNLGRFPLHLLLIDR
jgi:hypothetical protein